MAEKKKLPGGPVVGGNPHENAHGPSTTGSSTSVAQTGIGNQATAQGMGLGAPLQFGEAQPFSYFPGEAIDVVYPTFEAGTEAIATMLYGDRALAGQLEPTDGPRGPGYRFDPGLLESEWRSVYYQHLATQAGRRQQDELELDGMLLLGAPGSEDIFSVIAPRPKESHYEAVVVYLPAALPQLGGLGQNPASPSITMGGVSAPGPALHLTPVMQGAATRTHARRLRPTNPLRPQRGRPLRHLKPAVQAPEPTRWRQRSAGGGGGQQERISIAHDHPVHPVHRATDRIPQPAYLGIQPVQPLRRHGPGADPANDSRRRPRPKLPKPRLRHVGTRRMVQRKWWIELG